MQDRHEELPLPDPVARSGVEADDMQPVPLWAAAAGDEDPTSGDHRGREPPAGKVDLAVPIESNSLTLVAQLARKDGLVALRGSRRLKQPEAERYQGH